MKRIIALLLTVVMLFGVIAVDAGAYAVDIIYLEKDGKPSEEMGIDYEKTVEQYLTLEFATPEDKLASMEMLYEKDGYQLYVDELTGEVATKCLATGQVLFSNPYDVGAEYPAKEGPSASTKAKIMSQISINYRDNDTDKDMYSFTEAAQRGQITIKNIKNGIRVEYKIGREETRMLVPRLIKAESLETKIYDPFAAEINAMSLEQGMNALNWRDYVQTAKRNSMIPDSSPDGDPTHGNNDWFKFNKLRAFYTYKSLNDCTTPRERSSLLVAYPICSDMDVYVFAPDATNTELTLIESYIKTYVPTYTYEELEKDHEETEYTGQDKAPALFKLSLEYTLDKWGMSVRMPANGLRFNENLYQLNNISILPYMGAGSNFYLADKKMTFTGYNFFPDGSGTLFRHEDLSGSGSTIINGKVYGQDFAYNTIVGSHQEVIRYPVFGIVSNYSEPRVETVKEMVLNEETGVMEEVDVEHEYTYTEDRGYVAIIEEGDALAELSTNHEGNLSKYNYVKMLFYPRPKDSYNLANAISVGANATWTVVSSRKYVGNYKIRYIMLTDDTIAKNNGINDYYECSWMGMAEAYRDYLYENNKLSSLKAEDIKEDLPVYIQTFGSLETLQKILSIPVNVMTSLTSFDNVKTMYDELAESGVSNVKFRLVGYANGGMYSSIPYKLKWEKSVGGADGYQDLVDYANEKGFQVFGDFDFAYVRASSNTLFDGLTLKKHIVKSINNTYMSKRYYSATRQTFVGRFELAVSAAYYSHFYDKLAENLLTYYKNGAKSAISVGSLGYALNSDFDEDDPANREDSKQSTIEIFEKISNDFDDVMTESANAYTWKYVDYIVNVPLDSSRYIKSSAAVPFIGVVLHGSIQYAGSPLNMEGNIGYSLLKAIENGASLYFVLCYENYEELKEDQHLSEYYSVRYDILKEDVVKYYKLINDITKDLQLSKIVAHRFLTGERVPDEIERIQDELDEAKRLEDLKKQEEEEESKRIAAALNAGRISAVSDATSARDNVLRYYESTLACYHGGVTIDRTSGMASCTIGMETLTKALKAARELGGDAEARKEQETRWKTTLDLFKAAQSAGNLSPYAKLVNNYTTALNNYNTAVATYNGHITKVDDEIRKAAVKDAGKVPAAYNAYLTAAPADAEAKLQAVLNLAGSLENAKAYTEAYNELTAANAALKSYLDGLKTENTNAKAALDAIVKAADTKLASDAAYLAAKKALEDAQAAFKAIKNPVNPDYNYWDKVATTAQNALDSLLSKTPQYADGYEHQQLLKTIEEAKAKLAVTDMYTPEGMAADKVVKEAQAKLDSIVAAAYNAEAGYAAAAAAAEKAAAAYEADTAADGNRSAKFNELTAAVEAAQAKVDAATAKIVEETPIKTMYAQFQNLEKEKLAKAAAMYNAEIAYKTSAEYLALVEAAAKAAEAYNKIATGYTTKPEYAPIKAAVDAADLQFNSYLAIAKAGIADPTKDIADIATIELHDAFTYDAVATAARAALTTLTTKITSVNTKMTVKIQTTIDLAKKVPSINASSADYEEAMADIALKLEAPVRKEGEDNGADFDKLVADARAAYDDTVAAIDLLKAAEQAGAIWENKKAADAAFDAFVAEYIKSIENNADYKNALKAKTDAADAVTKFASDFTKNVKATAEYKALQADSSAANTAMSNFINDTVKAAGYTEFSNALLNLDNSSKLVVDREKSVVTNKEAMDAATDYVDRYNQIADAYAVLTAVYDAVKAKSDAAAEQAKVCTDLEKSITKTNTMVSNNIRAMNTYVATARTALENSELANKILGADPQYSAAFKADVADVYAQVKVLEAEVHSYSDLAIAAARGTIEESKTVLPDIALTVVDPYAPVDPTDEPGEEEEEEEEDTTTKYTDNTGNIILVTYENGVSIIENYNYFDVVVILDETSYTVPSYGGIRFKADGTVDMKFSASEAKILTAVTTID